MEMKTAEEVRQAHAPMRVERDHRIAKERLERAHRVLSDATDNFARTLCDEYRFTVDDDIADQVRNMAIDLGYRVSVWPGDEYGEKEICIDLKPLNAKASEATDIEP